jgi:hypothetical protein
MTRRWPQRRIAPYYVCPHCGVQVLTGQTPSGQSVTVEPDVQTYVVVWPEGTPRPRMHESRGYPLHVCTREDKHVS